MSWTTDEYFSEKLTPSTSKNALYTPLCLIWKSHSFFTHLQLGEIRWLCIIIHTCCFFITKLLSNGILPLSSWLCIWMIASIVECLGLIFGWLGVFGYHGNSSQINQKIKILFLLSSLLQYFVDTFVTQSLQIFIACTTFRLSAFLGVTSILSSISSKRFSLVLHKSKITNYN